MKKYLRIIFWLSFVATLGSLYIEHFGEPLANIMSWNLWDQSLGIVACNLCWYIRIFTYPVAIISLLAILYNDKNVGRYTMALAFICLWFCLYKYGLEMKRRSNGANPFLCVTGSVDCADAKPLYFGFITLSAMGIVINLIIICLSYLVVKTSSLWYKKGENS